MPWGSLEMCASTAPGHNLSPRLHGKDEELAGNLSLSEVGRWSGSNDRAARSR
jgi:hypothetical protein